MDNTTLATDVAALLHREAIRRLKHFNYCDCVDRMVAGQTSASEQLVSRFTDDIVADFSGFPVARGKTEVVDFYTRIVPSILSWCQHRVMNEVIDVDGDTATATWYVDVPSKFKTGNITGVQGSGMIAGRYQEHYVYRNGQWMWTKIVALLDVFNDMDSHWRDANYVFANR